MAQGTREGGEGYEGEGVDMKDEAGTEDGVAMTLPEERVCIFCLGWFTGGGVLLPGGLTSCGRTTCTSRLVGLEGAAWSTELRLLRKDLARAGRAKLTEEEFEAIVALARDPEALL